MKNHVISTKADTLLTLKDIVKKSYIEDIIVVYVKDFLNNKMMVYHKIAEGFKGSEIVVRSSSKNEDSMASSNAGHFESVLHVDSRNQDAVFDALTTVMDSYIEGECNDEALASIMDEEILVQRQAEDIVLSGVVFTRDILYNRPYYMVTYDDNGSTDSVTSGQGGKTRWIARNVSREFLDERFLKLIQAVQEVERIFFMVEALDIEFAIDKEGRIILFQVRPLAAVIGRPRVMSDRDFIDTKAYAKCSYLDKNHIVSDMAYWNPAEIIGTNPRPLDYSLYRELITERIWNQGLEALGYEHVEDELMQKIGNKPYISVNDTFLGLTPKGLDEQLKYKLFDYYDEQLKADKTAHDKIEFEIVFNVYDFMTDIRLKELSSHGFTDTEIWEIRNALFDLTKRAVVNYDAICEEDLNSLELMRNLRHEIRACSPLAETNVMKLYKYIEELLNSIKKYGTPQFTRQARCAFMARSFCRTLVERDYFTQEEMDAFMLSISTVASEFERDFDKYSHGEMGRDEFNKLYGHLRLGTYDIRTDCYRDMFFDVDTERLSSKKKERRAAKLLDYDRLELALMDAGIHITPEKFTDFLVKATQNREYFKFEFTKSLSLILEIVIRLGDSLGIAREDMSYLEIQDLLSYHSRDSYIQMIEQRRSMYHANTFLVLPEVIFGVGDIDVIDIDEARPNFITNKKVEADIVNLDEYDNDDITGRIVLVTKADPGYDWIFTKNIAGFVTKYGGAASHMAIRCAEFGIPAAIGCGEKIYNNVCMMKRMELDCAEGRITEKQKRNDV